MSQPSVTDDERAREIGKACADALCCYDAPTLELETVIAAALRQARVEGARAMRERAVAEINKCREEGESDMRSARGRIETIDPEEVCRG